MKLVYILGAGASVQAVPTYRDFHENMEHFIKFIYELGKKYTIDKESQPSYSVYANLVQESSNFIDITLREIKYFTSADTLAVAWKHEKDKLRTIKRLLASYILSQHFNINQVKELVYGGIIRGNDYYQYGNNLDRRYIKFWSSLLSHRVNNQIPSDISFVCWNYDFQILKALSKFIPDKQSLTTYASSSIIHLNGTALDVGDNLLYKDSLDVHDFVTRVVKIIVGGDEETIKFSWEEDGAQNVAAAVQKIKESDAVVIIGYSLPDYNLAVDLQLLDAANGKEIYLQSPIANDLKNKLLDLNVELGGGCKTITETDGFYIPPKYFGELKSHGFMPVAFR